MIEVIGGLAAVIGTICWLPQSIKTIRSKDTKSLSLSTNILLLSAVTLWFIYGIAIESWPLIVANTVSIILVGTIVAMKLRYG
ncbi:MAG: SemiSWEET transporter [Rhizobiaceae bacterium]|nr:SemiSWEET transporter [Rhizobiaceae bacterium]